MTRKTKAPRTQFGPGRPRGAAKDHPCRKILPVAVSEQDLARIDRVRGGAGRSTWARTILRRELITVLQLSIRKVS